MIGRNWDDDWFEEKHKEHHDEFITSRNMGLTVVTCVAAAMVLVVIVLCCCRARRRNSGHVISTATVPPPPPGPNHPTVYPQQQYAPYPTQPTVVSAYPVQSAYPAAAPYPTGMMGAAAPYAAASASPYPMPVPAAAAYPPAAPSAPDAHALMYGVAPPAMPVLPPGWVARALPPSYDQAVGMAKQPPYNPHAPQ